MFHWDISVAFTNAKAEEETYVVFPKDFPDDICQGYRGGTYAKLKGIFMVANQRLSCGINACINLLLT